MVIVIVQQCLLFKAISQLHVLSKSVACKLLSGCRFLDSHTFSMVAVKILLDLVANLSRSPTVRMMAPLLHVVL